MKSAVQEYGFSMSRLGLANLSVTIYCLQIKKKDAEHHKSSSVFLAK